MKRSIKEKIVPVTIAVGSILGTVGLLGSQQAAERVGYEKAYGRDEAAAEANRQKSLFGILGGIGLISSVSVAFYYKKKEQDQIQFNVEQLQTDYINLKNYLDTITKGAGYTMPSVDLTETEKQIIRDLEEGLDD